MKVLWFRLMFKMRSLARRACRWLTGHRFGEPDANGVAWCRMCGWGMFVYPISCPWCGDHAIGDGKCDRPI